jgi:hypothetical protein
LNEYGHSQLSSFCILLSAYFDCNRYPGVQDAIERADVKFKAQQAAQRKAKHPHEQ